MKKVLLYQIFVFTIHGKTNSYNNSKFKLSAPTFNGKFELPGGSYSVSDSQDYFGHGENTANPLIRIYVKLCLKLKQDILLSFYLLKQ